jgi:pimeloyl-ACP methyl ester carboxylesterase
MPPPRVARAVLLLAGFVVGGVSGIAYARYQRVIRQARERISSSRIALTACGPIEYAVAGHGEPVLLVHGAGGGHDQGLEFGQPLAQSGFRIIAMSRFGYLRTPLPVDASPAAQADAHACLLDALGIDRAAVVGASAGAPSAMQFALRHPDRCRAMVLLVPAAYVPRAGGAPPLQTPRWTEFLLGAALKSDFLFWAATRVARSTVIEAILATPRTLAENATADEQTRVDEVMQHILPISPRRLGLLNDAAVVSSLQRYELERIAVPTLVIGVADCLFGTFEPARYTAEHIPGARFVRYKSGGHLWVGHQHEIVSEIVDFLKKGTETDCYP